MKWVVVFLALVSTLSLYTSCASRPIIQSMSPEQLPNLTQAEAELRSKQIANVDYQLDFNLPEKGSFSGKVQIRFDYNPSREGVRLDFHKGQISRLNINGKVATPDYNGHFLLIAPHQLNPGSNEVVVEFARDYSRNGRGFHQFTDPEDGRSYVYTNLEPFEANKVFPCFDQPDLKATYEMKVIAPREWTVVTSVRETLVKNISPQLKEWTFPKSARFSTYIWSLHAGPFKVWEDTSFRYPLRLFARRSLAHLVDVQQWFPVTRQGFDFFDEYFGYPYPYKKYDQLIVPEFNSGAMENVAAVTFSERYVPRGEMSRSLKRRLALVIHHEMAHMWFGNLVTMKWWNDLWLNESFATFTSYLSLFEATEFKETWQYFIESKEWAYWEDSRITNHPIEGRVNDTLETFANFDGITYGKGAAVLKQLTFHIGDQAFQRGLKNYFAKFAEKNTVIDDFINELAKASGRDLSAWKRLWLQTAGTNVIQAEWACENGKINQFRLHQQTGKLSQVLRPHSFEVALLSDQKGDLKVSEIFKVEIDQARTQVDIAIGRSCPSVVFLNYNDHGFFRAPFDSVSLTNILKAPERISNPMIRHQTWRTLDYLVEEGVMEFLTHLDLVFKQGFAFEKDPVILESLRWQQLLALGRHQLSADDFVKKVGEFEQILWKGLREAPPRSEQQKIFFRTYIELAETDEALKRLRSWLNLTHPRKGLRLDADKRWDILSQLSKRKNPEAAHLVATEQKRDPSFRGRCEALRVSTSSPERSILDEWIQEFKNNETKFSYQELVCAARGLSSHDFVQYKEFGLSVSEYENHLTWANDHLSSDSQAALITRLQPKPCGGAGEQELQSFAKRSERRLKPLLSKPVRQGAQASQTCIRMAGGLR